MSRYRELHRLIEQDRQKWIRYRTECLTFAKKLVVGLVQYLGCSQQCITYVPTVEEPDTSKKYYLAGAMQFGDDRFYHFGVVLLVDLDVPRIMIPFLIRKTDESFRVRIHGLEREFLIPEDRPEEAEAVHEYVFEAIRDEYENGFQRWFEEDTSTKKPPLGFYRPQLPENEKQWADRVATDL